MTEIDVSRLKQAISGLNRKFERREPVYQAEYLSDNGDGTHEVYMLQPDGSRGAQRTVNGRVGAWAGVIVRISIDRKRFGEDIYAIIGPDEIGYGSSGAPTMLELHGDDHGYQQRDETANVHTWQVYPLRVQPSSGLVVSILKGNYYADGQYCSLTADATKDLTAYVGALTSGLKQYLMLSIDSAQTITVTEGTKSSNPQSSSIPDAPDGERALAAVLIYYGQTTVTRNDLKMDLRYMPGGANSGLVDLTGWGIFLESSGSVTYYSIDDTGMAAAIAAAASGDTIFVPPVALANDYSVPAGVAVAGRSLHEVVFSGQITLDGDDSVLERLSVTRSKNDASDYYGVVGPDTGTAYVHECRISVTQSGAGDGWGIRTQGRSGDLHVYGGKVYGSTDDALVN